MKFIFRTDSSLLIGSGHVMRCITLADELTRQGHVCYFVCRDHKGHLGELIKEKGHSLTLLRASLSDQNSTIHNSSKNYSTWLGVTFEQDASETMDAINNLNADYLVVDHYAIDKEWERIVANVVKNIVVIDDLANRSHECVLLLDQNLGRESSDYDGLVSSNCKRLIGPAYALLRPEFLALRERSLKRRVNPKIKRILISLGGVDRTNITGQILEAIELSVLPASMELDIVMGASSPHLNKVRQKAEQLPFKVTVSVNVSDMAERMHHADLSIGAVGSTSWERCSLGLPSILMVLAENQKHAALALKQSGAVIIADNAERVRVELDKLIKNRC